MGRAKKASHMSRDFRFHRPALYPDPHKTASGYIILAECAFLESHEKPFVKTRTTHSTKLFNSCLSFTLRNFFVFKIRCKLSCPKSAQKVRGAHPRAERYENWLQPRLIALDSPRCQMKFESLSEFVVTNTLKFLTMFCLSPPESKRIEQQGGYMFTSMTVPQTFNFGQ